MDGVNIISHGIAGLQFVLDRGSQYDWFYSPTIQFVAYLRMVGFIGFFVHTRSHKGRALFSPEIFTDRKFVTASLLMAFLGLGLFSAMLLKPLMLEELMGYSTLTTGLTLAPRGLASMVSMYNLLRAIGSGIGVSLVVTVLTRHAQLAWHNVGDQLQPFNPALAPYLNHLDLSEQTLQAASILTKKLARQSQMIGFLDAYIFVTVAFAAMLPLVFVMRNQRTASAGA